MIKLEINAMAISGDNCLTDHWRRFCCYKFDANSNHSAKPATVNSRLTDTPLLRALCKSPAKPIINYIAEALAITDSRYYGIADTLCGPQQTF